MSPKKPGRRTTKRKSRLTLSKKTIKDLTPRVSRVIGGALSAAVTPCQVKTVPVTRGCPPPSKVGATC